MAKYDLTEALETSFTFLIGDKEFTLRKPTVREMREVAKVFSSVDTDAEPEEQNRASEEAMKKLYSFVTPLDHDSYIGDVMDDQPVGVQIKFNEMIKTELGAQS